MVGLSNVLWNLIFYLIYIIILSFWAVWGVLLFRISNQKVFFCISILQVKHWKLLKDLPYFVKITCRSVNFYLSNRACRFTKKQVLLQIFLQDTFLKENLFLAFCIWSLFWTILRNIFPNIVERVQHPQNCIGRPLWKM